MSTKELPVLFDRGFYVRIVDQLHRDPFSRLSLLNNDVMNHLRTHLIFHPDPKNFSPEELTATVDVVHSVDDYDETFYLGEMLAQKER